MDDFDIYGDLEDVDYKAENEKVLLGTHQTAHLAR
jgi:hypothetical protein